MGSQRSLLQISRDAGDANLGQTLVRLATLATQRHQMEAARKLAAQAQVRVQDDPQSASGAPASPGPGATDGLPASAATVHRLVSGAAVRKEANR